MNALLTALLAGSLMLSGAGVGALLRRKLPDGHLNDHTKDIVRLGTGLVATISALVLGLLINSANANYEAQRSAIRNMAAEIILMDNLLLEYGPEARPVRIKLREAISLLTSEQWRSSPVAEHPGEITNPASHEAYRDLYALQPRNDAQRALRNDAVQAGIAIARARYILYEQSKAKLPPLFLGILVTWLVIIFASFSLFSPMNRFSIVALAVIAFSASAALFLILEMSQPFDGLMQISRQSLATALSPLPP